MRHSVSCGGPWPRASPSWCGPGVSFPEAYQPEGYLAADVAFGALAIVAGVAITIGLANMRRDHLASVLVAAMLASAVGTAAMWFVGTRLGSVDIDGLSATTTEDLVVDAPLQVAMPGMFVMWALASALVVTVLALSDWVVEVRRARRTKAQAAAYASARDGRWRRSCHR